MLATTIAVLVSTTKVNASSADDAKIVAALDTQYQAAVKENDAATMDQILADDFVLVTGRGKVYEKAELLKAAREKQVIYEHQDEEAVPKRCEYGVIRLW
jgi:ketosteroid isomerase-like protein